MIESTENLYPLWLRPEEISELRQEILEMEGVRLTGFEYDTFGRDQHDESERRPGHRREGSHEGDDALDILEDMKIDYGITPTQLRFSLPSEGEFQISNDGEFVMKSGKTEFLYRDVVERTLEKAIPISEKAQESELKIVSKEGIETVEEKPLAMEIGDSLDYEDVDTLISSMKESDFYPFDYQADRGSLLLSGRIIDEQNGGMLSISTDGQTLTILPRYDSGFDSLLRFYRFIIEEVDPTTSIEVLDA
jgi:hypothetical protein